MMRRLLTFGVNNPVLVTMVTVAVILVGLYAAFTIYRDVLPEVHVKQVTITTTYPGAAPEDVERGVTEKIEEAVEDVTGVDKIVSMTTEGVSTISIELTRDTDLDRAVDDIKAAVDTIDDFPEDVDEPVVTRYDPRWWLISVAIYGDLEDKQLKRLAEELSDELRDLIDIGDTITYGVRDEEISVELDPESLQKYHLSLLDVVNAIGQANLDVPGGLIRTPGENVAVRTLGERRVADTVRQIVVRARTDGQILTVGQVAHVVDGLADADIYGRFNGKPAASITVFRTSDQDAIEVADKIKALIDGKMGRTFDQGIGGWLLGLFGIRTDRERIWQAGTINPAPAGVTLQIHEDISRYVRDRLSLLRRNGIWGLSLVFLSLLIFLNRWVAFWVMSGVLLSLLGALAVMNQIGLTLNMISMFGLIMALGLLVDDAIIIGESVFTHVERGAAPRTAAIEGAVEVATPVLAAVVTTICALMPLSMMTGKIGDFLRVLPIVAAIALTISLFEALLLLPSHLGECLHITQSREQQNNTRRNRLRLAVRRFRLIGINELLLRPYSRLLQLALKHRYAAVMCAVSALVVSVGLVAGRRVEVVSFPKMDTDFVFASLRMPVGTPIEKTEAVLRQIEAATDALPDVQHYYSLLGAHASEEEPTLSAAQPHLGQLLIELVPVEERDRTSDQIIADLRRRTANLRGIDSLQITGMGGAASGPDIAIEASGETFDEVLPVVEGIKKRLASFAGVYEILDDFELGQREVKIRLLPSARALGLTTQWVSQQIRAAFHGIEARTIQRGREPVDIVVRHQREYRSRFSDLETMWISTPIGTRVPLSEVAAITEGVGYAAIHHADRRRAITVYASVDSARANADDILDVLESEYPALEAKTPGLALESTGTRRETSKAMGSIGMGFALAVMLIYVCLAWLFRSYWQPVLVMVSIPMAFVGVVAGHWLMGYPITILSRIGYVALAGIAVNDALILVDYANREVRNGARVVDAVYQAGHRRLRPIILTSLTTILGLAPLMVERSFQAKFLIPMAISVTFGLAVATFLTLLLVPALYLIFEDIRRFGRWIWTGSASPSVRTDGPPPDAMPTGR